MPYYELRPKVNESLRLNVSGNSVAANGQNVTLYSATGSNDQIWFVQEVGVKNQKILSAINQAYGLNAVTSGTWNCCLQLTGGSDATTSFEFEYVDGGCWRVKLLNQNRYLTCDGTTSGSNVSWKAKTGGDEQVWRFYPAFVNGPQSYAYMTAKYGSCTLHIIRTDSANIQVANLRGKALSTAGVIGINGGFFNPGTNQILNIAKNDGTYVGAASAPYNGTNNNWCGNGVVYRKTDGTMGFLTGQSVDDASLSVIKNLTGTVSWAQGGAGIYPGYSGWKSKDTDFFNSIAASSQRSAMIVDRETGFVYLIVTINAVSYDTFRSSMMTFLNLSDGATASTRYHGVFLDGGGSTQLRAKDPKNTSVFIHKSGETRALLQVITLRNVG